MDSAIKRAAVARDSEAPDSSTRDDRSSRSSLPASDSRGGEAPHWEVLARKATERGDGLNALLVKAEKALQNVYIAARRALSFGYRGTVDIPADKMLERRNELLTHIIRMCEEAGVPKPSILRTDEQDTQREAQSEVRGDALRAYVQHKDDCATNKPYPSVEDRYKLSHTPMKQFQAVKAEIFAKPRPTCTCGLDDQLSALLGDTRSVITEEEKQASRMDKPK